MSAWCWCHFVFLAVCLQGDWGRGCWAGDVVPSRALRGALHAAPVCPQPPPGQGSGLDVVPGGWGPQCGVGFMSDAR